MVTVHPHFSEKRKKKNEGLLREETLQLPSPSSHYQPPSCKNLPPPLLALLYLVIGFKQKQARYATGLPIVAFDIF